MATRAAQGGYGMVLAADGIFQKPLLVLVDVP